MALTETQQTKASVKINHVPTDVDVQTLFNNGSFNPGEIIVTPDEDVNLSQMRMSILWVNPNPSADFPSQTITLNSDDYDYLMVMAIGNKAYSFLTPSTLIAKGKGGRLMNMDASESSSYKIMVNARDMTRVSDIQYTISACRYSHDATYESGRNDLIIPYQIIGLKKTPAMIYIGDELNAGNGVTLDNGTVAVTDKVLGVPSNNNWIDVSVTNNSNVTYTAPANGYLMVQGAAASTSMCRVLLFNVTNSANDVFDAINGQGCYAYNSDNTMMGTTICKKGDVVKIYITNLKDIRARFVPSEV